MKNIFLMVNMLAMKKIVCEGGTNPQSPLFIEELPDFSLKDVEDKIKKNIRDHEVKYVFHDYIHTSLKDFGRNHSSFWWC